MKNLKNSVFFKILTIVIIIILLLIPTSMIKNLIGEREGTKNEAILEVSSKWATSQTVSGPFISIPYYKFVKEPAKDDVPERILQIKEYIHILPTQLKIVGNVKPEKRSRGIYDIVVYNSNLNLSGIFTSLNLKTLDIDPKNILFDKAEFIVGINDLRGIEKQVILKWNGANYNFNSGVSSKNVVSSGINAILSLDAKDETVYNFDLNIDLKGSEYLYFTPVGKTTDVKISSSWKDPSFMGAFLPDSRKVSESGFEAKWNILHLNRNYPQIWTNDAHKIEESNFGVNLLLPVDNYQKSYRSIQYAILFIGFTFLVFFFIEVLHKRFIHPIQYLLVGISLIIFYTLLLSISEHLSFNYAFIISAIATLVLITGYVFAILKSKNLTILISGILAILYGFIFIIIQLQDYALLIGSIGIFLILGLVMYFSRKIDWYNLNLKEEEQVIL